MLSPGCQGRDSFFAVAQAPSRTTIVKIKTAKPRFIFEASLRIPHHTIMPETGCKLLKAGRRNG